MANSGTALAIYNASRRIKNGCLFYLPSKAGGPPFHLIDDKFEFQASQYFYFKYSSAEWWVVLDAQASCKLACKDIDFLFELNIFRILIFS